MFEIDFNVAELLMTERLLACSAVFFRMDDDHCLRGDRPSGFSQLGIQSTQERPTTGARKAELGSVLAKYTLRYVAIVQGPTEALSDPCAHCLILWAKRNTTASQCFKTPEPRVPSHLHGYPQSHSLT